MPAAAPAVGDVAEMVAPENARFIVPPGDEEALFAALDALSFDSDLRRSIGAANREKARESYDEAQMIARYRALYEAAIAGRPLK